MAKGVRWGLLGLLAASGVACGPAPLSGEAPLPSEAPVVELPREAEASELVPPAWNAGELEALQGEWRGRTRFRKVDLGKQPAFVPYVLPSANAAYVPYYEAYDPAYYHVRAYAAPSFGSRSRLVRFSRRSER